MDRSRLLKELEELRAMYRKLAWDALKALSVYEQYLLDEKTSKEVGKAMKELFEEIPDNLGYLELDDFKETDSVSGNSPDSE
jgi:hypothetical protein